MSNAVAVLSPETEVNEMARTRASKTKKSTQRKLTAVLTADVVGYSRLMWDDDEGTPMAGSNSGGR